MSDVNKKIVNRVRKRIFRTGIPHSGNDASGCSSLTRPGDLVVSAVAVLPTSFLDRWQDNSVAGVAEFTGAIWQVKLRLTQL